MKLLLLKRISIALIAISSFSAFIYLNQNDFSSLPPIEQTWNEENAPKESVLADVKLIKALLNSTVGTLPAVSY